MLIKKFVGEDIDEIQARVIEELGPFAVILFTRILNTGFFKRVIWGQEYEVVVGIEVEDYDRHLNESFHIEHKDRFNMPSLFSNYTEEKKVNILVSGPVKFIPKEKNLVFLVGFDDINKTLIASKFSFKWRKETKLNIELFLLGEFDPQVKQQMHSLTRVFNQNCHESENEADLHELIGKTECDVAIIVVSSKYKTNLLYSTFNDFEYKTFMLVLSTARQVTDQISEINRHRSLNLFGLIYTKDEEKPSFLFLNELFEKQDTPISYLLEGSQIKLADADDLETRLINEKLTHLPSW